MNAITLLQAAAGGGGLEMIIMMVVLFAIVYFFMIRPQNKKQKEIQKFRNALAVGQDVVTIGGIHGTIVGIKDDNVTLAVGADKVKLVFARWAIRSVDEVSIENDSEQLV